MKNILKAPTFFEKEEEKIEFILGCEKDFEERLSSTVRLLSEGGDTRVVTLSGPTCSGKTTAARKLIKELSRCGKKVSVISLDDFYYDNTRLLEISRKKGVDGVDYDSEDTIDLYELERFEDRLFSGDEAYCPIFDFKLGRRNGYRRLECNENSVFIFEGIQAVYPKVTAILSEHKYKSMFISPKSGLVLGEEKFDPNELRLMRRIVRDHRFRNTSASETFYLWKGVRENEEKNILPFADSCDHSIDSSFAYEISLLKGYLSEILSSIPEDCEYRSSAEEILRKIKNAPAISAEFLPKESLYREFI